MVDRTGVRIHGPVEAGAGRRVLLLSYYFAPSTAVGALRWQRFATHFAAAGVGLDVVTLHPAAIEAADLARLAELPPGTRVFGAREPVPALERVEAIAAGLRRRLRPRHPPSAGGPAAGVPVSGPGDEASRHRDDILGDKRWAHLRRRLNVAKYFARYGGWSRVAARLGGTLLTPAHEAIISCGPPHPVHEAARRLSLASGLPHVVDMRDPWSLVERIPTFVACPDWYHRAERLERRVLAHAARVVMVSRPAAAAMAVKYPEHAERIITVINGCDAEIVPREPNPRFVLAYAGSVYLDRDPLPTFEAAARVVGELGLTPAQFGIEFMGNVQGYQGRSLQSIAEGAGVGAFLRVWPTRPRSEALAFLARASMLLSLPQDSDLAIPAKLYDYMQFDAWILAMTEPGSATWDLLQGTHADTVSARDTAGIAAVLRARYLAFARGEQPSAIARDTRFTRRHQALQLLGHLAAITGRPPAPSPT